ncbi:hypothetical protein [Streptomyces sp. ok210]|uniref:hypothetical protein n=1 Tax=Streptomyces sp. ok210 TaxID=1761905 RepID=UPI0008E2A725|nr:hypothetical protein [Streptomyces sp. ok210]SFT31789.1 hypothetical protein SAMN04487982_1244 [Streptomyces sp. ok210]
MNLRNAFVGLILVLTATVIPATPAMADPMADAQVAISGVVDLPVDTPAALYDFGWG